MTLLLARIWPYLLGAVALVAGWFAARQSGKASEKRQQMSDRIDSIKEAKNVHNQTAGMADDDIAAELKSKWVRDSRR